MLDNDSQYLTYASHLALYSEGNRRASKIVKAIATSNEVPTVSTITESRSFTPDEALALFIDCKLSKASYIHLRQRTSLVGHKLYPPYYRLQQAKQLCCVPNEAITVTESRVEVPLQAVLDLTVQRLCNVQYSILLKAASQGMTSFILNSKWGCDGSSGHSQYKQKFHDNLCNDDFLFIFSFVPIKMSITGNEKTYVWANPTPGSTTYCRPIKFMIEKESTDLIVNESKDILEQISSLTPSKFDIDGHEITITHNLLFTMIDGKICNAVTGTKSTQTCYICGSTSKKRQEDIPSSAINIENYCFGLSTLHAWIRTFECLLQIAYKLQIKKWQIRDQNEKKLKEIRKAEIQKRYKDELGLNVDKPKQGFGNSNDGNTARRFFKHTALTSEITGLDENLINRFRVILQVLSSGHHINIAAFETYASETKMLYMNLYPWFPMTVTVHKILEHSSEIIKHHIVPIGQLTEEAQEARNKDCRRFREHNTQKKSREATNKDLLMMLLVSSDPVISSFRKAPKSRNHVYDSDVKSLLESFSENNEEDQNEDEESGSEST